VRRAPCSWILCKARMDRAMPESPTFCGRTFRPSEPGLMRQLAWEFSGLGVTETARTVCELLDWTRPNGGLKSHECRQLLERLQAEGFLQFPEVRKLGGRRSATSDVSGACPELAPAACIVSECEPLEMALVEGPVESRRWREQMEGHHYPGCRVPFGTNLRYWVRPQDWELARLLWTSPAWKMQPRDEWIGWSDEQRRGNRQRIVNNGRFLILPWVRVKGLASNILALSARCMPRAIGKVIMAITRCCRKRWWMPAVFGEPAIGPPTGCMSGKPPGAVAWTRSIELTVEPLRISTSIPGARCLSAAMR
jgi:hypothetical protein